jgi:N6-L-threonylcarbamoyladenine synthase
MRILAIETSCDETGIALVEGTKTPEGFAFETKKAALLSQAALHAPYGGVYPTLAKREHEKNLPVLWEQFKDEQFDAIAVTHGPGLEPALWQGIVFAQKIAAERNLPLIPINHMEGHLISSLAQPLQHTNKLEYVRMLIQDVRLPVLGLLVSGGHTEFVLMKEWFEYELVGKTLDDAVGEAFDKVARMLGLPYPGGPEISKLARMGREKVSDKQSGGTPVERVRGLLAGTFSLPRPMINSGTCDFSFSGLKTAALYALRDRGGIQALSADEIMAFAAELEDAIADVLVAKARRALGRSPTGETLEQTSAKTFVIGGGVAANTYLRERLQKLISDEFSDVDFRLPELSITGDNAIMIAQAALARELSGIKNKIPAADIKASGSLALGQKTL